MHRYHTHTQYAPHRHHILHMHNMYTTHIHQYKHHIYVYISHTLHMYTTHITHIYHIHHSGTATHIPHIPHRCNIQYTCIPHTYDKHKTHKSDTHTHTIISKMFSSFLLFYVFSWVRGIRALGYLPCHHVQVYLTISNSWGC